ncbi:MAG: hypothetical protein DCC59_10655 [Chloroflexi bacterium]|nr:hypothetical protein [Anaerolineales bacterium]RIK52275.1 MAG: hypothetical protein DCC59_10655 [Chloroflexota bacterium]
MKKIPYWLAVIGGILFPILIMLVFSKLIGPDFFTPFGYLMLFLVGAGGGLILIFFLNRCRSVGARWLTAACFVLCMPLAGFPTAALNPILGGWVAAPALLVTWALFAWLGSLLGNFIFKK